MTNYKRSAKVLFDISIVMVHQNHPYVVGSKACNDRHVSNYIDNEITGKVLFRIV